MPSKTTVVTLTRKFDRALARFRRTTVGDCWDMGQLAEEIRLQTPYGQWEDWCASRHASRRTIGYFRQIFRRYPTREEAMQCTTVREARGDDPEILVRLPSFDPEPLPQEVRPMDEADGVTLCPGCGGEGLIEAYVPGQTVRQPDPAVGVTPSLAPDPAFDLAVTPAAPVSAQPVDPAAQPAGETGTGFRFPAGSEPASPPLAESSAVPATPSVSPVSSPASSLPDLALKPAPGSGSSAVSAPASASPPSASAGPSSGPASTDPSRSAVASSASAAAALAASSSASPSASASDVLPPRPGDLVDPHPQHYTGPYDWRVPVPKAKPRTGLRPPVAACDLTPPPPSPPAPDVKGYPMETRKAVRLAVRDLRARLQATHRARTSKVRADCRRFRDLYELQTRRSDWLQQQCRELSQQIYWFEEDLRDPTTPWEPTDWLERVCTRAPCHFLDKDECERYGRADWYWEAPIGRRVVEDHPGWDDLERKAAHPDDEWLPAGRARGLPNGELPPFEEDRPQYPDPIPSAYRFYGEPSGL